MPGWMGWIAASTAALGAPAAPEPADPPAEAPAATTPADGPPLVVATLPIPPFVVHDADGGWSGISIDVWKHLADELHLPYEIREVTLDQLLANPDGAADVAVSLNISPKSEAVYDMSHAFLSTGLAIAVRPQSASFASALRHVVTPSVLTLLGGVALLLVGAGSLMWLVERRHNEDAFGGGAGGWLSGMFWAIETVIGYNDPAHQTRLGRMIGILWAGFGVIVVSALTAQLSSQLTISGLETAVSGPDDLPRVDVGTVKPSAGWRYCERRGLRCKGYADARAALAGLAAGEVDAVVYEAPILQYHTATTWPDQLLVLPGTFANHGYGIGLEPGSPIREDLNRALLAFVASDAYPELLASYLGASAAP